MGDKRLIREWGRRYKHTGSKKANKERNNTFEREDYYIKELRERLVVGRFGIKHLSIAAANTAKVLGRENCNATPRFKFISPVLKSSHLLCFLNHHSKTLETQKFRNKTKTKTCNDK